MQLLNFKNWLVESFFEDDLDEMAILNFGGARGHAGKDHTQVPDHYLKWMKDQINAGGGNFNVSDNGRRLNSAEIGRLIDDELAKRSGTRRPSTAAAPPENRGFGLRSPSAPQAPQQALKPSAWLWAKSTAARPDYGLPAIGLDLAMKQQDDQSWMFVIIDPEEGRLVSRGTIPSFDLKNVVKSQKDESGQFIRGAKPSDVLKAITPRKESSGGKTIPEDRITPEQKAIEDKFERMLNSPNQSHMVISALAGSGKTTVLKHLAWKFARGKKWLYLVFNSKNKEEAKEEFPPNVQVETTNGWAGREVLGKNHLKPTDRIQGFSSSEKSRLVADSPAFKQVAKSLDLPDQNDLYGSDPKRLSSQDRSVWYALRSINSEFKSEAIRLLGLCKSFAVDPRNESELQNNIMKVMEKYDFNTDLSEIKEKLHKNSSWIFPYLDRAMGKNFAERDFTKELVAITSWLLKQVMPHGTEEKFTADYGSQKGTEQSLGTKRDFDDDLWFSAIHANELTWPKYDVVLADEVQDFNAAQRIILSKLAENGAKIVAVGDKNQAVYRFRGADGDSFDQLSQSLKDRSHDKDVEKGLTANFRSRQSIIDLANQEGEESGHVNNLIKGRPFKETPGKIGKGQATKGEVNYEQAFDTLSQEMKDMGEMKQTAFLARTNEPLVHASLKLMKQGIPFVILGKDIANDLNKHIDKIISLFRLGNDSTIDELQYSLESHQTEQVDKHSGKAAMAAKLKELKEVTEAMISSIEQFKDENPDGSVLDFRKWLRSKFGGVDLEDSASRADFKKKTEEQNPVILTTVHKSKGLQFQRVYILRDDLWPHPRSTRDEDLAQEMNNKYIGRTRGEDEVHILKLDGQPGYKPKGEE